MIAATQPCVPCERLSPHMPCCCAFHYVVRWCQGAIWGLGWLGGWGLGLWGLGLWGCSMIFIGKNIANSPKISQFLLAKCALCTNAPLVLLAGWYRPGMD